MKNRPGPAVDSVRPEDHQIAHGCPDSVRSEALGRLHDDVTDVRATADRRVGGRSRLIGIHEGVRGQRDAHRPEESAVDGDFWAKRSEDCVQVGDACCPARC